MIDKFLKGIALSPRPSKFGPVMFAGRLMDGLKSISEAGFKYAELSVRSEDDFKVSELNKFLNDLDLQITAVATGQACLFDQLCLGSEDANLRKKAVSHFKRITALALSIKSGAIIIGGIRGRLAGVDSEFDKNFDNGLLAIRDCAEYTNSQGIPLLIEPINRYETNWIFSAKDGRDILDKIGIASVKLLLDTFHMNIEESSIPNAIKATGDRLGYVHFADNTRYPPGQGQTNFAEIIRTLNSIHYEGPVVTEALPLPDDQTAVTNTAKFWEDIKNTLR